MPPAAPDTVSRTEQPFDASRPTSAVIERSPLVTWGFAFALAILGTAILWKTDLGINWGTWVAAVVVALFEATRERFGRVGAPAIAAGTWAVILALGAAITTNEPRLPLLMLTSVVLLAIALVTAGQRSLDVLHPVTVIFAPFAALGLVLSGIKTEAGGTARTARSPLFASVVRSIIITLPIVLALILLLAEADPVFAAVRDSLQHFLPDDFVARSLFFFLLFGVTLGAYAGVRRGEPHVYVSSGQRGASLGLVERRVLMTALSLIMWLFVASATVSLMRNPAARAGSGVTYAEYVHRGFAELSFAATLVIGVVLATRRSWLDSDVLARRLALAAIVGECGMIAIAFMRVVSYEQAYGFTVLRLYAQAYMVVLACMSVFLALEISNRTPSARFSYYSATAALSIFSALVFFNTDAWIVRENFRRYYATGKIDAKYLANDLSHDATPELLRHLAVLDPSSRAEVVSALCSRAYRLRPRDPRWFAWNLRASRSEVALQQWYHDTQPNCPAPTAS